MKWQLQRMQKCLFPSSDTIAQRAADLAKNIEVQLIYQIELAKYYCLQLDESTDISNMAIMMVYVRYEYKSKFKKEFLFSAALPQRITGLEISKTIIYYIENNG